MIGTTEIFHISEPTTSFIVEGHLELPSGVTWSLVPFLPGDVKLIFYALPITIITLFYARVCSTPFDCAFIVADSFLVANHLFSQSVN